VLAGVAGGLEESAELAVPAGRCVVDDFFGQLGLLRIGQTGAQDRVFEVNRGGASEKLRLGGAA
jgi:hypothetical protein